MKRLFSILLILGLVSQAPVFAASQWDKTAPAGTSLAADLDQNITTVNNEALDRLVINYRRGLGVNYSSASTLSVLAGELAIPNAAGTTVRWRSIATSESIGWGLIDTGAEENSTQYYVYATADTDITGIVFKITKSSSAPSGMTYYRKIAEFYNDASGNITTVKSLRTDDGTDYRDTAKAWINFNGTGTAAINESFNVASITDNGQGDYTVTFTTAFADTNYSYVGTAGTAGSESGFVVTPFAKASSSARIKVRQTDNQAITDVSEINLVFFGDQT